MGEVCKEMQTIESNKYCSQLSHVNTVTDRKRITSIIKVRNISAKYCAQEKSLKELTARI